MPNASPSTGSLCRAYNLLLAICLAFTVSHLFSVLPFGNTTTGYMPPVPAPVTHALALPQGVSDAALLSDSLSWEGTCQVIWAARSDLLHPIEAWASIGGTCLWLALPSTVPLAISSHRDPWRHPTLRYHLRAPPRHA